jgi:3-methyladenine DNA glycosylase/8-oxoguanine DNA glycosylase
MQMMRNLLSHYGTLVNFAGVTLRCFFTPQEIYQVPEDEFRLKDRLGYRAKFIGRYAEFFQSEGASLAGVADNDLMVEFQKIKGVGPYTAAVIASHASRDPSALGIDVWNRKLLARHLMGVDDASVEAVMAACKAAFSGYEAVGAMYLIEFEYMSQPVAPLMTKADLRARNDRLALSV